MMKHGTVTSVRFEQGVPICNVQLMDRVDNEPREVPVSRMHHGVFMVPEAGQTVQVLELEDQRFVVGVLQKNADGDNPTLSEGEMAFQLDADTFVKFEKDGSGGYNVSVNASTKTTIEAKGNVVINADGDVDIDAPTGTVYVDGNEVKIDGIDFDKHVHDHDDSTINDTSDGSGTESTETKTTGAPK